jgi:hypothetical protein
MTWWGPYACPKIPADLRWLDHRDPYDDWPFYCLVCGHQITWDGQTWRHFSSVGMYRAHKAIPDEESPVDDTHADDDDDDDDDAPRNAQGD